MLRQIEDLGGVLALIGIVGSSKVFPGDLFSFYWYYECMLMIALTRIHKKK